MTPCFSLLVFKRTSVHIATGIWNLKITGSYRDLLEAATHLFSERQAWPCLATGPTQRLLSSTVLGRVELIENTRISNAKWLNANCANYSSSSKQQHEHTEPVTSWGRAGSRIEYLEPRKVEPLVPGTQIRRVRDSNSPPLVVAQAGCTRTELEASKTYGRLLAFGS